MTEDTEILPQHDDVVTSGGFPLNSYRLTPPEVAHVYGTLLNRPPENQDVWTSTGALDALLGISTSHERAELIVTADRAKMAFGRYSVTNMASSSMITYNKDRVIGGAIRSSGHFEEQAIEEVLRLLDHLHVDIGRRLFIDVGANIGTHSLRALASGFDRAICVEADPDNFKLLRANQILNDVDAKCLNILAAASDHEGILMIAISPDNFGDHRVVSSGGSSSGLYGEDRWQTREIRSRTLDDILLDQKVLPSDVDLVWIDTQGHEGHVLSGARTLLKSPIPIVAEFWPYGLKRSGGYELLRNALIHRKGIYDLRLSEGGESLKPLAIEDLDALYDSFLEKESPEAASYTDLLIL